MLNGTGSSTFDNSQQILAKSEMLPPKSKRNNYGVDGLKKEFQQAQSNVNKLGVP